ncbi:MAG: type II and III secretion system protein family protein [Rickettsiales bacterium]|nr:type II and III secretion system protein family protein [Rickettsiales bacterium]
MIIARQQGTLLYKATRIALTCAFATGLMIQTAPSAWSAESLSIQADTRTVSVPVNRSSLIHLNSPMAEILIANPDIADVHPHNSNTITLIGKHLGSTNIRIFDDKGNLLRDLNIVVVRDLPAIRKALKNFLPNEPIGIEMVNTSVALTGRVSNASTADRAIQIVRDFVVAENTTSATPGAASSSPVSSMFSSGEGTPAVAAADVREPEIINMMQITSGHQVMLRVRVGEINRTALKNLGVNLSASIANNFQIATGANALAGFLTPITSTDTTTVPRGPGHYVFPSDSIGTPTDTQGLMIARAQSGGDVISGAVRALERDGLFKVLAEPNLVAVSGEQADFLAGGEIPIPIVSGSGSGSTAGVEYKEFGVAVKFTPNVLSETRIRMTVQPEVSELSTANSVTIGGVSVPGVTTRRAKTTVELAPGESFMIAGLLKDQSNATIEQLPGAKELPILGALFRSTSFQRNETELVIAVTPYLVDPLKSSDVKLPTDNFVPPSFIEQFFYGALSGNSVPSATQSPPLEGAVGFMMD